MHPNRLVTGLLWFAMRLLGRLPLPLLRALGGLAGRLAIRLRTREARVARRSLELCLPELSAAEREALWRRNLRETGSTVLESIRFWTRPMAVNLRQVREVQGAASLEEALAQGRGVIIATPHLGNWELLCQWLAARTPLAILYRAPRQAWAHALIRRSRAQPGVVQVEAGPAAVRTLFRALRDGGMVGILPDQQPKRGEGEFAPFFGIQALTMTLLPRLANRTGAAVLVVFAERLPDQGGFRIRIEPAPAAVADPDPKRAVAALNAAVEACVRSAPEQYQWSYKRFTIRPDGEPPISY